MNLRTNVVIVLVLQWQILFGQPYFQRVYNTDFFGTQDNSSCSDFVSTFDGGYLLAGGSSNQNFGNSNSNILFVRLDANGDTVWSKIIDFHTDYRDYLGYIINADSNSYVCSINTGHSSTNNWKDGILKINDSGNVLWTALFDNFYPGNVLLCPDSDYLFISVTYIGFIPKTIITKIDQNGIALWAKSYEYLGGLIHFNKGLYIEDYLGPGYLFVGNYFYANGYNNALIYRTDLNGNMVYNKFFTFQSFTFSTFNYIAKTNDNGYLLDGQMDSMNVNSGGFVMKLDSSLSVEWIKKYSDSTGVTVPGFLMQTMNGNYFIAGGLPVLMKLDINGNPLMAKEVTSSYYAHSGCTKVLEKANGDFYFNLFRNYHYNAITQSSAYFELTDSTFNNNCFFVNSNISTTVPIYLMDTATIVVDSVYLISSNINYISSSGIEYIDLCSYTSIDENEAFSQECLIFPNPANSSITISFSSTEKQSIELRIYNTLGGVQLSESFKTFGKLSGGKFEREINVEKWSEGIYFLQVKNKEGVMSKKLIVQH